MVRLMEVLGLSQAGSGHRVSDNRNILGHGLRKDYVIEPTLTTYFIVLLGIS